MKDKKIIAMFITSCVALVASVVITLGVALTLADPVPATNVLRCEFNFGAANSAQITGTSEDALVYENAFLFQPSGYVHVENWDVNTMNSEDPANIKPDGTKKVGSPLYLTAKPDYMSELMYENESLPTKVDFAAFRITNSTGAKMKVSVETLYNKESVLGSYMRTYVFDCESYNYYSFDNSTLANPEFEIEAGEYRDFILMVYVDEYDNTQGEQIVYGSAMEEVDIIVRNITF